MSAHLEQLKKDFSAKLAETIELLKLAERAVVQDENSERLKSEVLNSFVAFNTAIIRFENFCDYVAVEEPKEIKITPTTADSHDGERMPNGFIQDEVGQHQTETVAPAKQHLELDGE